MQTELHYSLPIISSGYTKTQLKIAADSVVNDLLENGNILEAAEAISAMEAFVKEVKSDKRYTDYVRDEIAKHGKVFTSASGTKIELAETGAKYDYSQCNDQSLIELEKAAAELSEAIKKRQDFLKTVPLSGMEILQGDELVKIFPPSKTSTSSYKTTIAK